MFASEDTTAEGKCADALSSPSVDSERTCVNAMDSALADRGFLPKSPISPKNWSF